MIRAKFNVTSVNKQGETETVYMSAATQGEENKEWAAASPSGNLSIVIANPAAQGQLEQGKSYFLDFTPAE